MKKTKRTARKVLSVFLSVLMILTTLTVAVPGIVLAADGNKYYVKVYVNIYDGSDGYGGAYTVNESTGKPDNYSWATNDGWYGRINMTGFTVFGEDGDYDAQDVSAALLEAEKINTYYDMSGLSNDNANGDWDSKAIATETYTFVLDSFPVEIFWMNDENNWDGGNTGFAIRKLTVATSEGGVEHTMWEGLAGSDSETYNYYGSITPTGIHTCFEDYAKNYDMDDYKFYKAITTSSQRAWADPYSAGSYGTYYLNEYANGGVSATFSEGVESVAYNVDYINTGSTDTYYMNFINHSKTQSATIVGVNNSDKFVNNPAGTVIPAGGIAHFELKNISSLGGDGGVANFCFNYTLDNVYASDALDASLAQFYQPCYVGVWNSSDDSKSADTFQLNNFGNFYITFQTNEGILVTNSTSGSNTAAASFNYTYYVDTAGIDSWEDTGLRFHMTETNYRRINFQNPDYSPGTLKLGGSIDNSDSATLRMADFVFSSLNGKAYTYSVSATGVHGLVVSPTWPDTNSDSKATLYNNNEAWCRFGGVIFEGSSTSTNPGTIEFTNMKFRDSGGYTATFSGTINVYTFDKTELRKYIHETLLDFAPMKSRYNESKFNTYETALSNAMSVLANQKTNQYNVNQAYNNLKSAVEALQTNANLVNQIDELTHIQYVGGIGSEIANQTAKRYVLVPLGEHTVPQKDEYIGNGTYKDATNKKSNLTTNYTVEDTEIDYLNYYYWNIDYSQIDPTIALLDNALTNFDSDTFSSAFNAALVNAKDNLAAIDQTTTGDNNPTSQEDVDNVVNAAKDLLAHIEEGYEHCDYDANNDGEDELKTKDSTCSEAGYTYYKCNICGKVQKVADLSLAEHDWNDGEETVAPKCGKEGVKTYTCNACGATKTEAIEAGEHDFVMTDLGDGTHISKCSKCDANKADAVAEAHTYNYSNITADTHTATCSVCGATETVSHTFTNPVLVRPTLVDGAWVDGTYTYTCVCGQTKTEAAVRADYSELEEVVDALEELKDNENLTDEAKEAINAAITKADELADDLVTAQQDQIDALVKELQKVKADADEAIRNKEIGVEKITEATSGVKVQFIDESGLGAIDSIQLGKDNGFIIRVANGNADSDITVTKLNGDAVNKTLGSGESTDFDISADGLTAGVATYTITYTIDGLKDADGNPVEFTTKAYLYVKAEAYNPYHYYHEEAWQGQDLALQYYVEADYGDFTANNPTGAEKFNDNMDVNEVSTWRYDKYDYGTACYDASCTGGTNCTAKSDAHLATYNYYVDTSLVKTWEDAGFRTRFVETAASNYDKVNLKYLRLAVNQTYLDGIAGDDKTFTVTFVPSASGTANAKMQFSSTGDLTIQHIVEPANDTLLFGSRSTNATNNTAYANFSGTIPTGINKDGTAPAMFMFAPKLRMTGGFASDEASYMTTHIALTSYDKAALREAAANAEQAGYNSEYFNAEKYEAYESALKNAKEVLGKAETNQNEIDAATAALNVAIADLSKAENEAKFVLTVTHSIHESADKNSEATGTEYDYYLVNGAIKPALKASVIALETINKYDAVKKITVTADTEHTYNYWYIDYSSVQGAIDAADAIINDTENGYSEEYKQQAEDAKKALEDILDGKKVTTTPESQSTVNDAIDAVTDLTGHTCNEDVVLDAKAPTCTEDGLTAGAKCSVCGKITKAQETDPKTGHNYDKNNDGEITRDDATYTAPVETDGVWSDAVYTYTCQNGCGDTYTKTVARADYEAYDKAVEDLNELLEDTNLTEDAKEKINEALEENDIADNLDADSQQTVTDAAAALNDVIAEITGENKDKYTKVDFTDYNAALEIYNKTTVGFAKDDEKAAVQVAIDSLDGITAESAKAPDNQDKIDAATAVIENLNSKYEKCASDKHTWGDPVLTTAPTADTQGEYTETCGICGTTQITKVDLADYSEFNTVVGQLEDLLGTENLTDEAKTAIEEALDEAEAFNKNLPDDATTVDGKLIEGGQDEINALVNELKDVVADTNAAIADGSALKPDYTAWEEAEGKYDALTEEQMKNVKDEIIAEAEALKAEIAGKKADKTLTQATATQVRINEATARLNEIIAGIKDGTLVKPDYSGAEEAIDDAKKVADSENIPDDTEAEIEAEIAELEKQLNEIKDSNPSSTDEEVNDKIAEIEQAAKDIIDTYGECAKGNHTDVETDGDHNCDVCGKLDVTSHNYADPQLTRPVYDKEKGEWSDGYYTSTCNCGDTAVTSTIARADYEAYDKAVADLNALLENGKLTQTAVDMINAALEANDILDDYVATLEEQAIVDNAAAALQLTLGELTDENGLKKEYEKVDYTNYNAAVNAYEALKDVMTAEDKAAVEAIKAEIAEIPADGTKAQYQAQVNKAAEDIAAINAKYGDCANGNHTWGDPVLTTEPSEGKQGEYTETCTVCGTTQITKVDLADYSEFNTVVGQLEDLLGTENLTDEAKTAIEEALDEAEAFNKNLPADATTVDGKLIEGGQNEINALVAQLQQVVADTNTAIGNGSALLPDYDAWNEAEGRYDALDKTNVKADIITEAEALKAEIAEKQADDTLTQATATQAQINAATARLNEIIEGINNGSLKDPADYTEVDKDLADAKDKAENNDVVDGVKDDIQEIEDKLNELKNDPTTNADDQDEIDALEKELEEIIAGIEDGSLVKPDYAEWDKAEGIYDALDKTNAPEDLVTEANGLKNTINVLKADPTANATDDQQAINEATARLNAIIAEINGVLTEKPDFTQWNEAERAYDELTEEQMKNVKAEILTEVATLKAVIEVIENDETATKAEDQDTIDDATARLNEIIAGITDGSLRDPDYSKVEEKLEQVKGVENLTDYVKEKIEDIEEVLEGIQTRTEPEANVKVDQSVIDALEQQLDEILAGIADGSALKPDYDKWEEAESAYDALDKTNIQDEIITEAEALKAEIAEKQADDNHTQATATQKEIDDTTARLNEIIAGITDGSLKKPADYTEVDNDLADAKDKAENNDVVDGVKDDIQEIEDKLNELKNDPTTNADDQDEIDALEKELEEIIAGIEDGSLVKPDYAEWDKAEDAYDALDKTNVKDEIIAEADALKAEIAEKQADDTLTQATATQAQINAATARLNEIIEGINNGSLKDPADYTEVDKDLADAKDKAENNDVVDGVKEDIKEIEDKLNELKNDPTTSADDQDEIDALEDRLEEIIAGIDDGSLVKPDYTDADEAIAKAEGNIDNGGKLSDDDKAALDELKKQLDEIKDDPASNKKDDQTAVDAIKDAVQDILDKYSDCASGNHDYTTTVVAPTCTQDGYKLHTCEVCGKTSKEAGDPATGHTELVLAAVEPSCSEVGLTEGKWCPVCETILVAQQEIAKLPHVDADDDGVCDNCNHSGLYDGCACLCHNNNWFWRIVYLIIRIIWKVFNIHPVCACGRIHY